MRRDGGLQRAARGGRAAALLLVGTLALGGCSGGSPEPPPPSGPAVEALQQAQTTMTSLRSYAFRLTATSTQGGTAQRLGASGRVQTPDRIAAEVSLAGRNQQVVGVPEGQFVLAPGGRWQRVTGSSLRPIPWPQLLGNLGGPTVETTPTGSTVTGSVAPADAATFGFPAGATLQRSTAVVRLDPQHHVTRLDLTLAGVQGSTPVEVIENVELDGFDGQAPVVAPGGVV